MIPLAVGSCVAPASESQTAACYQAAPAQADRQNLKRHPVWASWWDLALAMYVYQIWLDIVEAKAWGTACSLQSCSRACTSWRWQAGHTSIRAQPGMESSKANSPQALSQARRKDRTHKQQITPCETHWFADYQSFIEVHLIKTEQAESNMAGRTCSMVSMSWARDVAVCARMLPLACQSR